MNVEEQISSDVDIRTKTGELKNKKTVKDFDKIPEGIYCQLIDGEIIMSSPAPSFSHQELLFEIAAQIRQYVKKNKCGFVVCAPIDVYFSETEIYEPDIVYISNENKNIIQNRIKGVPDLVVGILSPGNAYYDLTHKKYIYEYYGVKEYWIVNPEEKTIEILENINKEFVLISKARKAGIVNSKILIDFSIDLSELFAQE